MYKHITKGFIEYQYTKVAFAIEDVCVKRLGGISETRATVHRSHATAPRCADFTGCTHVAGLSWPPRRKEAAAAPRTRAKMRIFCLCN
uniref:Uncharacterized protein n=1 Tax=Oryza nivara TaxID=4536 RepID=A0A0E0GDR3_ORYNI